MSHESILKLGLSLTVAAILCLTFALTYSLGWSLLAIATLLFVVSYPLIWLATFCYRFWSESLMQLCSFAQLRHEGDGKVQFKHSPRQGLLTDLQQQISKLGSRHLAQSQQRNTIDSIVSTILDAWNIPVALFDSDKKLIYRNQAMSQKLAQPMLTGTEAAKLGFNESDNQLHHPMLGKNWQCQTMTYRDHKELRQMFWAVDIHHSMLQQQSSSQNNLVRVLGHEIRNSLTPFSSLADTLLSQDKLPEEQTRQVLQRIAKRSDRLLRFIERYSTLHQLPPAAPQWFELKPLIDEAKTMVPQLFELELTGELQVFADPVLMSQVFINLLKNAAESSVDGGIKVNISHYHLGHSQIICITDNGPGFANLENVMTPFYTTKAEGSGIGLALCAQILSRHGGKLEIGNTGNGAKIELTLPIPTNFSSNLLRKD